MSTSFSAGGFDWDLLRDKYPDIYTQRTEIVDQRIKTKLKEFGTECRIIQMQANGNCMLNAFLYHNNTLTKQNVITERQNMISFMHNNKDEYESAMDTDTEAINDYASNYEYLDEIHLNALHLMYKINIVVFEYHIDTDNMSQNYYYKQQFRTQPCIFVLYSRHSKHYDYVVMDENYKLPTKSGYIYSTEGTKYIALQQFDETCFEAQTNTHQRDTGDEIEHIEDEDEFLQNQSIYTCNVLWVNFINSMCRM